MISIKTPNLFTKKNTTHANDIPTRSTTLDASNNQTNAATSDRTDSSALDGDTTPLNQTMSKQRHVRHISHSLAQHTITPAKITQTPVPLSPAQHILQVCAQPVSLDTLMQETALSFVELNEILFELQISGKITQTFAGLWRKK